MGKPKSHIGEAVAMTCFVFLCNPPQDAQLQLHFLSQS